jgi:hypothetical protein
MPPEQEGVTQEPDAVESGDKGLFRFMRRRPAKEKRSQTEWVDTLRAQPDPEEEPPLEDQSPFMAGEPEAEPMQAEPEAEPEPAPENYRVERQWRRRHKDEMDEIHNYIDRVIGTDRDPLLRHKRLAEIGINRHTGKKRDLASVDVEGLDEELMIAFTFPKEELRGARMVYETEGGYVIEVTRAVGGDDEATERQYYTVSRVGSVAHVLDKLRAKEIQEKLQQSESSNQPAGSPTSLEEAPAGQDEPTGEPAQADIGEHDSLTQESTAPQPPMEEASEGDQDEPGGRTGLMGGFASRFKRDKSDEDKSDEAPEEAPVSEGVKEPAEADAEDETLTQQTEDDTSATRGFGGFASRFKPGRSQSGEQEPTEEEGTGETDQAPGKKKGGFGFKRNKKNEQTEVDKEESTTPSATEQTTQAAPEDAGGPTDEADADDPKKGGLLGGLPGFKKRGRNKQDDDQGDVS